MHAIRLLLLILLCTPLALRAQQEGCTDPQANNYDSLAQINDGSCQYPVISIKPETVIRKLPRKINETSGLIYWRNAFWTHNDSGGLTEIYKIDSVSGKILQTIILIGVLNIDWEDIDHDDDHIYIGDFGNNLGNRRDLVIYKIDKLAIPLSDDAVVVPEIIRFRYGDQNDYSRRNLANDFDCEAMISHGDSLFLFSKNWVSLTSRMYAVPKTPGNYTLFPLDEFNSDGLITGATFDFTINQLVLSGYKNFMPFIWIMNDFWRNDFFGGNKRKLIFPFLRGAQTEGITHNNKGTYFISSERTQVFLPKLFVLHLNEFSLAVE